MMKKLLILSMAVATALSPLLPRVFADSENWSTPIAAAVWEYDYYRVEQLSLKNVSGPYGFNDGVFVTSTAKACTQTENCELVDLTMFKDGETLEIDSVSNRVTSPFWHSAQDDRFIYRVPDSQKNSWGEVYEYDSVNGSVTSLAEIERDADDITFMTFATDDDRIYFGTIHEDETSGDVESELSVYDYDSGYGRDDFSYQLTARWQEIVDVHDGVALVKFQFSGGFEQLWLIDQTARSMEAIPDTWTEDPGEIIGAHFLSDGSVRFFRNYRLWSYHPETDATPVDAGGAFLSWVVDTQDALQIVGDRMAYIDDENGLYVSDTNGVRKFGVATNGNFHLEDDAIYFKNLEGTYVGYDFSSKTWETTNYLVTDTYDDVRVGIDASQNVWYENLTTGRLLNIGYGAAPTLSDREHAYWKGVDGKLYEVTFSPLLDLAKENVEVFISYTSNAAYLIEGNDMWLIPDETTYFTWFDSWSDVLEVSQATLDVYLETYTYKGNLKLAPGTRVKSVTSAKVYIVGSDYQLHWITSETVADEVFGSDWNQGIIEVSDTYLWNYAKGSDIDSASAVRSI